MLRQWNNCTLNGFIKKNPDKSISENFKLLTEELSQIKICLDDIHLGDRVLYNNLIEACRQNPTCQLAYFRPSHNLQGLIKDLNSSIATFEDTEKSNQPNEVLLTDRLYHKYPARPRYSSQSKNQNKIHEKKPDNNRRCYVCGAKRYRSSKNSEFERQQSKERFSSKLNKKASQFLAAAADTIDDHVGKR